MRNDLVRGPADRFLSAVAKVAGTFGPASKLWASFATGQLASAARLSPLLLTFVVLAQHGACYADDVTQATASADDRVAATVDGKPIYVRQIERQIEQVFKDRPLDSQARPYIEAQTLEQLVKRRLILSYLAANDAGATEEDLSRALKGIKKQLAAQDLTLEKHLAKIGLSQNEFRAVLSWQIGWQRYLDRYLTEENLQRYFKQHHKQFDGTQLRIAHILIKVDPADDSAAWSRARQQAKAIRSEIVDGKLSFAEAARKNSHAPSGKNGGDIGFILRNKPMPEGFSRTAFELSKGEVSQPVRSKFGIHLIQCVDVKPGDKSWKDVKKELTVALTRYLFDWVSGQQRKQAEIEYGQGVPHFRLGTSELAN